MQFSSVYRHGWPVEPHTGCYTDKSERLIALHATHPHICHKETSVLESLNIYIGLERFVQTRFLIKHTIIVP